MVNKNILKVFIKLLSIQVAIGIAMWLIDMYIFSMVSLISLVGLFIYFISHTFVRTTVSELSFMIGTMHVLAIMVLLSPHNTHSEGNILYFVISTVVIIFTLLSAWKYKQ